MARMRAVDAAAAVMRKEGVSTVFGVPGAAINPLYSAMQKDGLLDTFKSSFKLLDPDALKQMVQ